VKLTKNCRTSFQNFYIDETEEKILNQKGWSSDQEHDVKVRHLQTTQSLYYEKACLKIEYKLTAIPSVTLGWTTLDLLQLREDVLTSRDMAFYSDVGRQELST